MKAKVLIEAIVEVKGDYIVDNSPCWYIRQEDIDPDIDDNKIFPILGFEFNGDCYITTNELDNIGVVFIDYKSINVLEVE